MAFVVAEKTQGVSVVGQHLSFKVKPKGVEIPILHDVSFATIAGEMMAIMGPSGSGKTSLINILAGRVSQNTNTLGHVYFNGCAYPARKIRDFSAYVMQEDRLLEYLTVQETVMFAANLRLGNWSAEARQRRMQQCLRDMGLVGCQDVLVGGPAVKGISGGQRKRVSIAVALLANPQLLFLDEPTSGLDASLAYDVIKALDDIVQTHGHTVICTIHQPRAQVFELFDTLLLLRSGKVVYRGPAEAATQYFAGLGFACPSEFNPPDFLLDILTETDTLEKSNFAIRRQSNKSPATDSPRVSVGAGTVSRSSLDPNIHSSKYVLPLERAGSAVRVVISEEEASQFADAYSHSTLAKLQETVIEEIRANPQEIDFAIDANTRQICLQWIRSVYILTYRDLKNGIRNPTDLYVTMASSLLAAVLFGSIWWQTLWPSMDPNACGEDSKALRNLLGAMLHPLAHAAFMSFHSALAVVHGRALVNREASSGLYTHTARFFSAGLSDLCFFYWGPLLQSTISYWCFGLQSNAARFFTFLFVIAIVKFAASSFSVMCGSFAPNVPTATTLVPLGFVLFFFISGMQLADNLVPTWLVWLQNISYIRFGLQAIARDQFQNNWYLDACAGFRSPHGVWKNIGITAALSVAFRCIALVAQSCLHKQIGLQS